MESYKIKSTDKCKPYYRLTIYLWTFQFKPVEAYFPVFTLYHRSLKQYEYNPNFNYFDIDNQCFGLFYYSVGLYLGLDKVLIIYNSKHNEG